MRLRAAMLLCYNLFDMNQKYADVLPLEEVLDYLDSWRDRLRGEQAKAGSEMPSSKLAVIGAAKKLAQYRRPLVR